MRARSRWLGSRHDRTRHHRIYASTHGHTAKIATRLAQAMQCEGLGTELLEVSTAGEADPADYDIVVVAASLHKEHHQPEIVTWVRERRTRLEQHPSVFCSVSLSAADDSDEALADTRRCIDLFCEDTGWTPTRTERIAGCLQYREYGVFTRQLMRLLMKRMGHPTDASHDYDYTEWDAVDRLGRELAELAAQAAGTASSVR